MSDLNDTAQRQLVLGGQGKCELPVQLRRATFHLPQCYLKSSQDSALR